MKMRMNSIKTGIKCVLLTFLWTLVRGDTEVSCVFLKSCILPCSFPGGTDVKLYWNQVTPRYTSIHSYYSDKDQLLQQDQRFRGRTSLFKDQISSGNTSLKLTGVKIQDEGRYRCYASTIRGNEDSFINLKVDAPVYEVTIQQVENRITCSSEGIYPEPNLTWSTSHSSILKSTTIVRQNEQQLYNITSSLITPEARDGFTDVAYSCTVSTRSNNKTAILPKAEKANIAKGVVVGVIMVAALVGLAPLCCDKYTKLREDPEKSCWPNSLLTGNENSQKMKTFSTVGEDHKEDHIVQNSVTPHRSIRHI